MLRAEARRCRSAGLAAWVILLGGALAVAWAQTSARTSKTIGTVLREPLPPEDLTLSTNADEWVITGPTFAYHVRNTTGAITGLRVASEGKEVMTSDRPAEIQIDGFRLGAGTTSGEAFVVNAGKSRIVLRASGVVRDPAKSKPDMDYTLVHTFFNDGVLVSEVSLAPRKDLHVQKAILCRFEGKGRFSHYLHKRRDEHGDNAVRGNLPEPGKSVRLQTLTSCLQVFSPTATLALFTDSGGIHMSRENLDTATLEVEDKTENSTRLSLTQYVVQVAPRDEPYLLEAGKQLRFRVGLSLGPNRVAPPRLHDLRMFAWIGDAKYPYPTDQEIAEVSRYGYTLFQMHRLGTPGEPRPPAGELERVIRKVHELGMLFLWTENADLMYDNAPGVQDLKGRSRWRLWQGFNYNGRYKASMDPFCDLAATCLASPNGLADYRVATYERMMDRFSVDGMYVDDNLAYPNCTLWREHGHPQPVYDCLIELHEINWRRRQLLRGRCPHMVLVSHNTRAIIQPIVCDFDALLYGEGYSFGSLENYWDYYRPANGLPAQGMIWPGGLDPVRCAAALAYNYDLLTGGGQYCEIDWRLFPEKFPYGAGVTGSEPLYVLTYNLAQYYFGLYESRPYYFADSARLFAATSPQTHATIYHNQVWNDWLIAVANMGHEPRTTSLLIRAPAVLGFEAQAEYMVLDTCLRVAKKIKGSELNTVMGPISIPAEGLKLYYLRQLPPEGPYHLWGGKRISEVWNPQQRKLTVMIQGPATLQDTVLLECAKYGVQEVRVAGKQEPFFFDPACDLVHGQVTFTCEPLKLELLCTPDGTNGLREKQVSAGRL